MPAKPTAKYNKLAQGSLLNSESSTYQVESFLGQGTFGMVVKCKKLDDNRTVAIKMIKLKANNTRMINHEVAILKKINSNDLSKSNIVLWNEYFVDRGHVCLEFEHLDRSLLDFMEERKCRPLPVKEIRPIVQQVTQALEHLKSVGIIHADLKLENVMLVDQLRQPYRVKLIDFGLACKVSAAAVGSYVQTRYYRSPEILLGNPFGVAIDMWSLGCIAAALYVGALLYHGRGEYEMIKFIMETQGQLPVHMLNKGRNTRKYFRREVHSTTSVWTLKTPDEYARGRQPMENRFSKFSSLDHLVDVQPVKTQNSADRVAETSDINMFVDMLKAMLQLDPDTRATPCEVLEHRFISMHHIARMKQKSSYVVSCFQRMKICQKEIPDSRTATNSVQPSPSDARSRKTHQPDHTGLLPCTSIQLRGTDESNAKRSVQGNCDVSSSRNVQWRTRQRQLVQRTWPAEHRQPRPGPSDSGRAVGQAQSGRKRERGDHVPSQNERRERVRNDRSTSRDDHMHNRQRQTDQKTRPAEHRQPRPGPSDSGRTVGQAQSGRKRERGDQDDVPSQNERRKRVRNDRSTSRGDQMQTSQRQPGEKTRPVEHHGPSAGPSHSTRTEGQAQSGLKRERRDQDDVRSQNERRKRVRNDRSTNREDRMHTPQRQRSRPAEQHHPSAGPSDRTRAEGQVQSGLKRKRGDHDDVPSQNNRRKRDRTDGPNG